MILLSFPLALIAIVYGAQLLAQSQKEALGALYKYLAWFVIVMGFLVLLCDGAHGLMRMCHRGEGRMLNRECILMGRGGEGHCMRGGEDCRMMMHGEGNGNCCMHGGGNCCDGMMNCKDGGKEASSCNEGSMPSGCPMMEKMKCCKMDSTKAKK